MFVFLFSTLIHFAHDKEQWLFELYLFACESGEWGVYDPSPPPKISHIPQEAEGGGMWVSNGLLVWSILTLVVVVACSITVLVFQAQRHLYALFFENFAVNTCF